MVKWTEQMYLKQNQEITHLAPRMNFTTRWPQETKATSVYKEWKTYLPDDPVWLRLPVLLVGPWGSTPWLGLDPICPNWELTYAATKGPMCRIGTEDPESATTKSWHSQINK